MWHCGCLEHNERTSPSGDRTDRSSMAKPLSFIRPAPVRVNIAFKLTENHSDAVIFDCLPVSTSSKYRQELNW